MRCAPLFLACMFAAALIGARQAEAGIPIPCTGQHVVLVGELPPDVQIQTRQGLVHIDLGYKFTGCTGGKWVGYAGEGRAFYNLPQATLELYAFRAGLNGLPPEPSYLFTFSASWPVWLWAGIFGLTALAVLPKLRVANPEPDAEVVASGDVVAYPPPSRPRNRTPGRVATIGDQPTLGRRG